MVNDKDASLPGAHWWQPGEWAQGDFNADGLVNDKDAAILVAYWEQRIEPRLPGDANRDGVIDDKDASILGAHWQQQSGYIWEVGDFNLDGKVDDKDAAILAAHGGQDATEASEPPTSSPQLGNTPALTALIGPRPASTVPVPRPRVTDPRKAAHDAALAQEYCPPTSSATLQRQRLAWASALARRQSHERDNRILDRVPSAVDLLMAEQGT